MPPTPHTCGAAACTQTAITAWVDTMDLTPNGHRQYLVCAGHLDQLADRKPVDLVPPSW